MSTPLSNTLDVISSIVGIGSTVALTIVNPQLAIPSLIAGTVVGTVAAIAHRIMSGKSFGEVHKDIQQSHKFTAFQNYTAPGRFFGTLLGAGLSGYLLYARLTSQAVHSAFSVLGSISAVGTGFGWGLIASFALTDKIISVIDQHALKTVHA